MKKLPILLFSWFAFGSLLIAGVQEYNVTPSTLTDWQISGADRDKVQAQDTLNLPAGAELTRTFNGGAVALYTVSSPDFGSATADWPVVQVGPAALALIRQGNRGQVAILVGDTVNTLPLVVPLDAGGHSIQPLELVLGYDPATKIGVVAFADQVLSFRGTSKGLAVEVAVAAGANSPWTQDSLEVLVIGPDSESDTTKAAHSADAAKRAALLQSATEKLRHASGEIGGQSGSGPGATKPKSANTGARLEIYTPPAVRHGAAAVRAAIAQSQKK